MRGEVTGEIMLVVAVLISVSILLLQVQQLAFFQIESSKEQMTKSVAKDVASIIDSMGTMTGDARIVYEPPRMWYSLNITEGFVFATGKDGRVSSVPYTFDCVIPNRIENQREIIIEKNQGCVHVGYFESCNASSECDSGYCWGSERDSYICQDTCAENRKYTPDADSCCINYNWDDITEICYDTGICAAHEFSCNDTLGCCVGLECVNETGTAEKGRCCFEGWYWNETTNGCEQFDVSYSILIVPLNWDNNLDYDNAADIIGRYYLERIPLRDCIDQFELLRSDLMSNYGPSWTNGYCNLSSLEMNGETSCYNQGTLARISSCGNEYRSSTGNDFDFIIGIDDDNIAYYDGSQNRCLYSVGGWSDGKGFTPSVIVEATNIPVSSAITTHELGHEFGVMEQYCDCTGNPEEWRCSTKDIVVGPNGVNQELLNPLKLSLGCGGAGDTDCNTGAIIPVTSTQDCQGVKGNYDMFSIDLNGVVLPGGKRTAMSNRVFSGEFGAYYSIDEYTTIAGDSRMRCYS